MRLATIICFALLTSLSPRAGAVGKVTVDPNTSSQGAAQAVAEVPAGVDKRVSISKLRQPVSAVVDELSKQSGVKLYSGKSSSDKGVRDLLLTVVAADVPLKDLMQSISEVMKCRWNRSSSDGGAVYRLVSTVEDQEPAEEAAARELKKRRRRFFNDYMSIAGLSAAEMERLKVNRPDLYGLAQAPYAKALAKLLAQMPAASMSLIEGKRVVLRGGDIPLDCVQPLMSAIKGAKSTTPAKGQPLGPGQPESLSIEINHSANSGNAANGLGEITISCGGATTPISFPDPQAPATPAPEADEPAPPPDDPVAVHPDEPDLHKKIKLEMSKGDAGEAVIGDVMSALSKASGFAFVADDYNPAARTVSVPVDEIELRAWFELLASADSQNWQRRGNVIEFRNRQWAKRRKTFFDKVEPVVP